MKRAAELPRTLASWFAEGDRAADGALVPVAERYRNGGSDNTALAAPEPELLATLDLLGTLEADAETLAACILYTFQLCGIVLADADVRRLPAGVVHLIEGQHAAEKVWSLYAARSGAGSAEGLRRLLLAIIRDLRVVLILLARQLARLRAAATAPPGHRHELAQLTADIHAPLANRLGIWQFKWELEDLAFRYLQPDT